jgi:pantoate--beta-alanine ligase
METITEPRAMQAWSDAQRAAGRTVALVPTMGALHAGHVALVEEARRRADRVVVSIFVNPIQFDRRDDFERYPRALDEDAAVSAAAGAAALFAPSAAAMYPEGFQTAVEVGRLTEPLCGRVRPGHFRGVTTVVTKLFHCVRPHVAVFGEKDFQQLAVVRRMTADLDFGIEIVGVRTVREADGSPSRAEPSPRPRIGRRRCAAGARPRPRRWWRGRCGPRRSSRGHRRRSRPSRGHGSSTRSSAIRTRSRRWPRWRRRPCSHS